MTKDSIERSIWIAAPRERVWQAVIDPAQITQWFAPGTSFSQKENKICILVGASEIEVALIEVVDPPRQLTTRSLIDTCMTTTYLLEEVNGGTQFTVIESGFASLPENVSKDRFNQDNKGWETLLQVLKNYVESN